MTESSRKARVFQAQYFKYFKIGGNKFDVKTTPLVYLLVVQIIGYLNEKTIQFTKLTIK